MKWVAVLKSDQLVHKVVGLFKDEHAAQAWIGRQEDWAGWYACEIELLFGDDE